VHRRQRRAQHLDHDRRDEQHEDHRGEPEDGAQDTIAEIPRCRSDGGLRDRDDRHDRATAPP
jgi:hypothetical protein